MSIPFVTLDDPRYGECIEVAPLMRRVIAKNPSKFSYKGTGTYIVGRGEVAVIDPGPNLPAHQEALARALEGERVTAILVTHCHADHSPSARWLHELTGAPTVAFGPHLVDPTWVEDDSADVIEELDDEDDEQPDETEDATADEEEVQVEESTDVDFVPDITVRTGDLAASGDGWSLRALHTPGHTSNHTCFWLPEQRALFSGDHLMGWSTTVIAPPDGDMTDYFDSLRLVQGYDAQVLWPTHGSPVTAVAPFIEAFIEHRLAREAGVLRCVRDGVDLVPRMVKALYVGTPKKLHKAAGRSVLAHLLKLQRDGLVAHDGAHPGVTVRWHPV